MGGVLSKIQPELRVIQKMSLAWLFSFTESPGGMLDSGLWEGSAGKGVSGEKSKEAPGRGVPRGFATGQQGWRMQPFRESD